MATVAQGIQAGQLANGIVDAQNFVASMQAAIAGGQTVFAITIGVNAISPIGFRSPVNAADSAIFFNSMISLTNMLIAQWTARLDGL